MIELLTTWILSVMLLISPVEKRVAWAKHYPHNETVEQAKARYNSIARDMATVVAEEEPIFKGKNGRIQTAQLLIAVTFFESGYRKDVDDGKCIKGSCDAWQGKATSFCLGQIHIGEGKTAEGWTGADLIADRKKCLRASLHLLKKSIGGCGNLSGYTLGTCQADEPKAVARWNFAQTIPGRVAPPKLPEE